MLVCRTSTAGQGFMPTEAVTRDQSTKDVINFIIGEGAKVHPSLTLADMGTKGRC